MFSNSDFKCLLNGKKNSRKLKLLLILAYDDREIKSVATIKQVAQKFGLQEIKKWNVSQILKNAEDMAIRLPNGWEITNVGVKELNSQGLVEHTPIKKYENTLRAYAKSISSKQVSDFLAECISALELKLLRSALYLSLEKM